MSRTPILEQQQPLPEPRPRWISRVIGFVIGAALSGIYILSDLKLLPAWRGPAANLFLLLPGFYLAIAFHELGHAVFGRIAGLDIAMISAGAFRWTRSQGKWIFAFNWRSSLGGFVKPVLRDRRFDRVRFTWLVAGGPLASFLLTAAAWALFATEGSGQWHWIGTLFYTALFIAILCLLPISGAYRSDGTLLWCLFRAPERLDSWVALIELQTEESKGTGPRDWSPGIMNRLLQTGSNKRDYLSSQLFLFYWRAARGETGEALTHMENMLAGSAKAPPALRQIALVEASWCAAALLGQPALARVWRGLALKPRKPSSLDAVDAEIAMAEGDFRAALNHWQLAQAELAKQTLDSGLIRFARRTFAEREAFCRKQLLPLAAAQLNEELHKQSATPHSEAHSRLR